MITKVEYIAQYLANLDATDPLMWAGSGTGALIPDHIESEIARRFAEAEAAWWYVAARLGMETHA